MTTKEILIGALERVRRGWITKAPAATASGETVPSDDETAVCWCAIGAIWGACGENCGPDVRAAEIQFLSVIGRDSIACWNDAPGRTQAEVCEAFEKAIAACPEEATP